MIKLCSSTIAALFLVHASAFGSVSAGGGLPHESLTGPDRSVTAMIVVPGKDGACALSSADTERLLRSSLRTAAGTNLAAKQGAGSPCPESLVQGVAQAMPSDMPLVRNQEANLALAAYVGACVLVARVDSAASLSLIPDEGPGLGLRAAEKFGNKVGSAITLANAMCVPAFAAGTALVSVGAIVYFSFTSAARQN